jgi:hypothetical protein
LSPEVYTLRGEVKEEWERLCDEAASEQDPERLIVLIEKINELLLQKEHRLQEQRN